VSEEKVWCPCSKKYVSKESCDSCFHAWLSDPPCLQYGLPSDEEEFDEECWSHDYYDDIDLEEEYI